MGQQQLEIRGDIVNYRELADNFFSQTCEMITFNTRDEWLKMRMDGIGGSDVSCIMGHNTWRNRKDIFQKCDLVNTCQI